MGLVGFFFFFFFCCFCTENSVLFLEGFEMKFF